MNETKCPECYSIYLSNKNCPNKWCERKEEISSYIITCENTINKSIVLGERKIKCTSNILTPTDVKLKDSESLKISGLSKGTEINFLNVEHGNIIKIKNCTINELSLFSNKFVQLFNVKVNTLSLKGNINLSLVLTEINKINTTDKSRITYNITKSVVQNPCIGDVKILASSSRSIGVPFSEGQIIYVINVISKSIIVSYETIMGRKNKKLEVRGMLKLIGIGGKWVSI